MSIASIITALVFFVGDQLRTSWRHHLVAVAAGIFLAIVGAFGTSEAPPLNRLTFWVSLLFAGSLCAGIVERVTSRRPAIGERRLLRGLVVAVSIAAPMAVFSWALARLLFGTAASSAFWLFVWAALVISGTMTALMALINTPGVATSAALSGAEQDPVQFRGRLAPPLKAAEIYAVAAEDHYLRVHSSAGSAMILMRLSDAILELNGIEGAQVHRSWWVARDAVEGVAKEGRRIQLRLKSGIIAPVSRPNIAILRAAGWI